MLRTNYLVQTNTVQVGGKLLFSRCGHRVIFPSLLIRLLEYNQEIAINQEMSRLAALF